LCLIHPNSIPFWLAPANVAPSARVPGSAEFAIAREARMFPPSCDRNMLARRGVSERMLHSSTRDTIGPGRAARRRARAWRHRWWMRLGAAWVSLGRDRISIMAAGTAYYALLSIFPGMSALVLTYGLIADPAAIERHVDALAGVLPSEALALLTGQLHTLVEAPPAQLGVGLVISILFAVWSATSGTVTLMQALTVAYKGKETRGFFAFYGQAVALTVALGMFGLIALMLIASVPVVLNQLPLPASWREGLPLLRWPVLAALALIGMGTVYRVAPCRLRARWDVLRAGTIAASLLWLFGSAAFAFYAAHFGAYDRTYGSLGAVALLLVWLYVTAYIILAGAELNAEIGRDDARNRPRR
jgi:membrane protein